MAGRRPAQSVATSRQAPGRSKLNSRSRTAAKVTADVLGHGMGQRAFRSGGRLLLGPQTNRVPGPAGQSAVNAIVRDEPIPDRRKLATISIFQNTLRHRTLRLHAAAVPAAALLLVRGWRRLPRAAARSRSAQLR